LKQEVLEVVQFIGDSLEDRQRKQKEQMRRLGQRLRVLRTELAEAQREMAIDPLTRIYNRSALDQHLKRMVELSQFSGQSAGLLMLDADHFKGINDQFGHQAGDKVLETLADHCVRCFPRKSDFVARYGGEEFAIVVDDASDGMYVQMGERLLDAVRDAPVEYQGERIEVTASIGLAVLEPEESADDWLRRADLALLQAKEMGRDRLVCAESEVDG
jgi:diguanylate cyclase (GGDEF)-like protein